RFGGGAHRHPASAAHRCGVGPTSGHCVHLLQGPHLPGGGTAAHLSPAAARGQPPAQPGHTLAGQQP
ncbi:hypothetical protein HaLaN_24803, partial [Haematococcus lacustris]